MIRAMPENEIPRVLRGDIFLCKRKPRRGSIEAIADEVHDTTNEVSWWSTHEIVFMSYQLNFTRISCA